MVENRRVGRSGAGAPSGSQASPGAAGASPPSVSIPNAVGIDDPIVIQIARAIAGRGNAFNLPDPERFDRLGQSRRTAVLNDAVAAWTVCEREIAQRMKEAGAGFGLFGAQVLFDEDLIDALLAGAASAMSAGTAETPQAAQGQRPASAVGEAETPNE